MRRLVIPIAALIAVLAIPAGANAYTLGVSDQQASTFTNPLFAPLKFKAARYITPYDVMESPADKAQWDAWYTRRDRREPEGPRLLRALPSQQLAGPEGAHRRRVHEGAQEVQGGLSEGPRDLALERGQPLPPHDRRERPGPADQALQPDHRSQGDGAVLHGRSQGLPGFEVHDRRRSTSSTSRTSTRRSSTCSRSCATRRRTRRSSASTTTRTRTASRPPAPSACWPPSTARCG